MASDERTGLERRGATRLCAGAVQLLSGSTAVYAISEAAALFARML